MKKLISITFLMISLTSKVNGLPYVSVNDIAPMPQDAFYNVGETVVVFPEYSQKLDKAFFSSEREYVTRFVDHSEFYKWTLNQGNPFAAEVAIFATKNKNFPSGIAAVIWRPKNKIPEGLKEFKSL